ncbi:HK97 gp10 family phage protein [Agrobacterium tumefaciens]|uniref:HK97-gp10 family putative phage morphogenesis protein n=1 Tax=Agrobacterium tumefaciens TaxID=358 RepID=UPI0015738393|nr:HK97-gp10 family putative phage morphogenesis protein [Agrobacterium tumefaciens]NSZ00611.1 HK97 gp10 family phage protein [Agrobacterium tumefaciens]NSZ38105.1 HK97 gp10 family phage protein [Agrobacterium tumefaciens]NTB25648.1 HK97 gp10 family phage protein [Agrobacterium tumefaciens]NTB27009.1 HK97 gp10 family phage protein [Agrobacterium tumefaciens]NTB32365.1 HK97 gp10 family phage protein [Agrobacterium tumefaciens]
MADGLDDLMKAFDRVKKAPRDAVLRALATSAESISSTQRALAPEDTGALKDSITVTLPGQSTPPYSQPGGNRVAGDNEVIITVGDTDTRYPHLVEYGTSKTDAQPFFWPGFRLQRKRAQQRIDRAGRKAIRDAWNGKTSE